MSSRNITEHISPSLCYKDAHSDVCLLLGPLPQVFLHSGLQHENIITMHAAFQEGDKVIMVQVCTGCMRNMYGSNSNQQ